MNLEEFCRNKKSNVHNFCFGTINSYYNPTQIEINSDCFYIVSKHGRNRYKRFTYNTPSRFNNEDICYSTKDIGHKRVEIAHNLYELFDPKNYTRKKRYNTIIYPFNWANNNNLIVKEISYEHLKAVTQLHTKWVDYKLKDEKTFKMMFPKKRYLNCFLDSLTNSNYISFGAFLNDSLVSVRTLYLQDIWAFDLAFFTDYIIRSQLTNFVDVLILKYLQEYKGIDFLNRGVELNKGLKQYKTQYPYFEVFFYEHKPENKRLEVFENMFF